MEEKPNNLADVQTKHADGILTAIDQSRKDVKSNHQDLMNALTDYEKRLRGINKTGQVSKVTVSVFDLEESPPQVDVSAFTWEGQEELQKHEDTISAAMAYLININVWLGQQTKESGIVNQVKVENIQKQSEGILDVRPRNWLETIFEHSPFKSQTKKAVEKQVGLAESQFGQLQFARSRWDVYCKQFHNKFVPLMTELGRTANEPAMVMTLQRCIRNFADVRRIILSVIPIGYTLELDRRLNMLAQALANMNSANATAMAAQAQLSANAGSLGHGMPAGVG